MGRKRNHLIIGLLTTLFLAASAALFFSSSQVLPLFAAVGFLIFCAQLSGYGAGAFMMVAFTTLTGVFCLTKTSPEQMFALPVLLVSIYAASFLLYWQKEKLAQRRRSFQSQADDAHRDTQSLAGETAFYENRLRELATLGEQRRKLSRAAHELGALLDPAEIQKKLIDLAGTLFPSRAVAISYGQTNDPVDAMVVQRRGPVVVPDNSVKFSPQAQPLMAVPVMAQQSVAGILRVGGDGGPVFGKDDFRVLEILASLASLSLDNSLMFGQVQDTALRDSLTGLITHKAFQEQLEAQILEASRYKEPLSVIMVDIDHFKSVNDSHGHQAGDAILQGVAHVLARNVRDVDVVSRYGGEEFAILLLQTNEEAARGIAENIRRDLVGQPFDTGRIIIACTASFGVAGFPDDATSAQQLLRKADERLYQAKQGGRNRVRGKL